MEPATLLSAIGVLFLAGLVLDALGRRVHVPRVTMLILLGTVIGPPVLDWLPSPIAGTDDHFAPTALTMVAFLLGGGLRGSTLKARGREILVASLTVVVVSAVVVGGGMALMGFPVVLALMLGGVSGATDPAATHDVVRQSGAHGRFATNLLGIVAVDDGWGLLVFSLILTFAGVLAGHAAGGALLLGLWEVAGAVLLGLAIGLPAAFLSGRLKPGEPTLIEALGIVFLCTGLALHFEVSFLLTGMVCGATVVNLARHHEQSIHEIERIEWPFMLLFFVMAGASLQTAALWTVLPAAAAYVALRLVGRIIGGLLAGRLARLPEIEGRMLGIALLPQAGVAIGMALVAADRFPQIGEPLLAITIASTIAFEVAGPILTQWALARVGRRQAP